MPQFSFKSKGFSLVELLVVIVIIAVLIGIAIPSYESFVTRGRDAKRKADLKILQSALEQYRADQSFYPTSKDIDAVKGWELSPVDPVPDLTNNTGKPTVSGTVKTYLARPPQEPLSDDPGYFKYVYKALPNGSPYTCSNASSVTYCISYCLYAQLERSTAPDKAPSCTDANYNFAVSAP